MSRRSQQRSGPALAAGPWRWFERGSGFEHEVAGVALVGHDQGLVGVEEPRWDGEGASRRCGPYAGLTVIVGGWDVGRSFVWVAVRARAAASTCKLPVGAWR